MNPARKRFLRKFGRAADEIALLDIDQEVREDVAAAVTRGLDGTADFDPTVFRLLASDPLCECAGSTHPRTGEHVPCPNGVRIRIAMHLSTAPDGRSKAWRQRKPEVRCVTCGAKQFVPGYAESEVL